MNKTFLSEVLGAEGAKALERAVDRAPLLKSVLVPRTVISWLSTMGKLGFEGSLPGKEESYFALIKSEDGTSYSGALTIDDQMLLFKNSDLMHVAATVGVALGLDVEAIGENLKSKDLSSLGKSIDLLVKSQIITRIKSDRAKKLKKDADSMSGAPGPAAAPRAPEAPDVPVAPQKTQMVAATAKAPIQKPNIALGQGQTHLKVAKHEASMSCNECDKPFFNDSTFLGCFCLADLSKAITTEKLNDGFLLTFDKSKIDEDAILTIINTFKA